MLDRRQSPQVPHRDDQREDEQQSGQAAHRVQDLDVCCLLGEIRDRLAAPTVFRERYLPQLPAAQWSPVPVVSWPSTAVAWFMSYNGPNGGQVDLTAAPGTDPVGSGGAVTTVRLGTRQGLVTGTEKTTWRVTWQADGTTYSLRYVPGEGCSMTWTSSSSCSPR